MIFWKRVKQAINDLWYPRSVTVGKPVETQGLMTMRAERALSDNLPTPELPIYEPQAGVCPHAACGSLCKLAVQYPMDWASMK